MNKLSNCAIGHTGSRSPEADTAAAFQPLDNITSFCNERSPTRFSEAGKKIFIYLISAILNHNCNTASFPENQKTRTELGNSPYEPHAAYFYIKM